jgi:dolichol-phosphate mannosyltransferase
LVSISVIMPALNEEKNLRRAIKNVLNTLDTTGIDGEIVIINDGSTDGTQAIIEQYLSGDQARIKSIRHLSPQGIGASFWDGLSKACKDTVVMLPGDGENDAYEVIRYLSLLENVDVIVPYAVNKEVRSLSRNFLSALFLLITNISFRLYLNYTNGTIVYRRSALCQIDHNEAGFFFQVEALIKVIKKGYRYAEVPYSLSKRLGGTSKAVRFKSICDVMAGYLRLIRDIYFKKK